MGEKTNQIEPEMAEIPRCCGDKNVACGPADQAKCGPSARRLLSAKRRDRRIDEVVAKHEKAQAGETRRVPDMIRANEKTNQIEPEMAEIPRCCGDKNVACGPADQAKCGP